jgi:tetratricopeptide (TPR) repeat protein
MRSLVVVAILVALPTLAFADKKRADKLFEEGRGYLQRKEYALACTAFEQSHQADPAIGTQLNIALCYEEWGKLAAAYKAYVEAERLAKAKKDNRSKHARKKIDELEPKLARLRISVPASADPYSIFLFDGKETDRESLIEEQVLDPGSHSVEVRVAGAPPKTTLIELRAGERKSLQVELPEIVAKQPDNNGKEQPRETRTTMVIAGPRKKGKLFGGIALGVLGLGAFGLASYVALDARADYNDAIASCSDQICTERGPYDTTQDARSRANQMTFVAAGGVVLVGVGVFLILTSKGDPITVEKVSARPLLGPDTIGLAIGGPL